MSDIEKQDVTLYGVRKTGSNKQVEAHPVQMNPDGSMKVSVRDVPPRKLDSIRLGTSETTVFKANRDYSDVSILFCNNSASAATVTIYLLRSGESAGDDEVLLKGYSCPANSLPLWWEGGGLKQGDSVTGLSGTANAITVTVTGKPA